MAMDVQLVRVESSEVTLTHSLGQARQEDVYSVRGLRVGGVPLECTSGGVLSGWVTTPPHFPPSLERLPRVPAAVMLTGLQ